MGLRRVAHLSDLHFGRIDASAAHALIAALTKAQPHLVVISGDLTQRARPREFIEARDFLKAIPSPQLVVPGNHDVPLYDLIDRWLAPLRNYRRYITGNLEPFFADDEIAVLGLNSARSNTLKNGRINREQVERGAQKLDACGAGILRIVVTHHPFDFPVGNENARVIGRAAMAMAGFSRSRVDMILSGHLHRSDISDAAARYAGRSVLLVQAGTATSTRRRGEVNAFNLIRLESSSVSIESHAFDAQRGDFRVFSTHEFQRGENGWLESAGSGT
jgi:3',5'-cyclic AMP phosphodiesterase CpdA